MTLVIKGKEAPPNYLLHPTNHWIPLKLLVQHNEEHMTKGSITTTKKRKYITIDSMNRSELQSNKTTILGMTMTDNKQQHVATSILLMITNHWTLESRSVLD